MRNKKTLKIGMFDSGIGGLTILSEVHKFLPDVEIIYIADKAFAPYGEKKQSQLIERAREITQIFIDKEVSLITLACNTITAAAIKDLRKEFKIPFVGIEPYLNAFNKEADFKKFGKIGVLTTRFTASSEKFWHLKNKLDPQNKIYHVSSSKLATIIEDIFNTTFSEEKKEMVRAELRPLKDKEFTHIILGCTHYPLIINFIEEYLGVTCIAPGKHIALRIKDILICEFDYCNLGEIQTNYAYLDTQCPSYWSLLDYREFQLK